MDLSKLNLPQYPTRVEVIDEESAIEKSVRPVWDQWEIPEHYKRTETAFTRVPIAELYARGFKSEAIKSMLPFLPPGVIVAGGAVLNAVVGDDKAADIDLFFTSAEAFEATFRLLTKPPNSEDAWALKGYTCKLTLDQIRADGKQMRFVKFTHPDSNRLPIQMIKMVWFEEAEDVIDSFDFTVTQFAVFNNTFVCNPMAMMDLYKKRLNIHKMQFPATTLRRLIKYTNKGFFANPNILVKIAESIRDAAEISDPNLPIAEYDEVP